MWQELRRFESARLQQLYERQRDDQVCMARSQAGFEHKGLALRVLCAVSVLSVTRDRCCVCAGGRATERRGGGEAASGS